MSYCDHVESLGGLEQRRPVGSEMYRTRFKRMVCLRAIVGGVLRIQIATDIIGLFGVTQGECVNMRSNGAQ